MEPCRKELFVNRFAPKDDRLWVFFKKVHGRKSDGFAVVCNGEVVLIDAGGRKDGEMLRFLAFLRAGWLDGAACLTEAQKKEERLAIRWIISHPHPDHIGAIPSILADPRFCVLDCYGPTRTCLGQNGPNALPSLVGYEEKMDQIAAQFKDENHIAQEVLSIPFGTKHTLCAACSDTVFEIYPSQFDWSEDRGNDFEGIDYLKNNCPASYQGDLDAGCSNGILNGNSLWVKITKGTQSVLITGDQRDSDEMLGSMIRFYGEESFSCDVLKLPHHGQKNYPPYLLKIAKPKITVFTTSKDRATPETAALCEAMCDAYYLGEESLMLTLDSEMGIGAERIDL